MSEKIQILSKYNIWGDANFDLGYVRNDYINLLSSSSGNRLIKVIVGQRRVGKSYLLRQMAKHLIDIGINKKNIFFVNREFRDFGFLENESDLNDLFTAYIKEVKPKGKVYIFIDEIQNIYGWETFVNSYSQDYTTECELFISGSNSKMLSGELATLLSGRYIKFQIYPFSYNEYLGLKKMKRSHSSFAEYINAGGLPELYHLSSEEIKDNYIVSLKDTILLRDIIKRYKVNDANLLEDIFIYICNNASNLLSVNNITNYFKSKGRKCSFETVSSYISYIEEAFLIYRVEKYNISGKEVVSGTCKYYVNDLSFRNYLYRGFVYGLGYQLENIVFLDLLRAGYSVYTGNTRDKEIDFVAINGDRTIYIQCAYLLADEGTVRREYAPLESIKDNFEKYVVSMDDFTLPSNNGILHIQAWNLSDKISLEP